MHVATMIPGRWCAFACLCAALLAGCQGEPAQALGTLEFDRVTFPAPAAERIVAIHVREGDRVTIGQPLLSLEATRTDAALTAARADSEQRRQALVELEAGPRHEQIAQARAQLAAAQAQEREAQMYYVRLQPLGRRQLVAASDVDLARAAAGDAQGRLNAAQAALDELLNGNRDEDIAQGQAALQAAQAQSEAQQVTREKLDIIATRDGVVDSIPYKLGDQAPIGVPLMIVLAGNSPYARIYVPEQQRADLHVGDKVRVFVAERTPALTGTIRMIRSEPTFTPYYALIGEDAERLSYLAEITLGKDAVGLPAGLPVRVELTP